MKRKRTGTFLIIIGVALILAAIVVLINSESIFQEGNPLPVISGIWQIVVNNEPYAQIKEDPPTYIARAGSHEELVSFLEDTYGVQYERDEDNRFFFTGDGKLVEVVTRSYAKSFRVWEVVGGVP